MERTQHCRAPARGDLAEVLCQLMGLVAPADRVATMTPVFAHHEAWPGTADLTASLDLAGIAISEREQAAVKVADAMIQWARRDRRTTSTEDLSIRWRLSLGDLQREVLEVALLDAAGRLIPDGVVRLHEGSVDRVVVQPRRIMELAIRSDAAAVVLAHNHPSGCVDPTRRDLDATRQLVLAGTTLDVTVADHLIVSSQETFSFHQEGLL